MIVPDVNVLVHAWQPSSAEHERYRVWLEDAVNGTELIGLAHVVLSGTLRVLTHPRIFEQPADAASVLERVETLRLRSSTVEITPNRQTWVEFAKLCRATDAVGNDVPDAYLSALAISNGATLVTADRGFARFPGLRWTHPLDI